MMHFLLFKVLNTVLVLYVKRTNKNNRMFVLHLQIVKDSTSGGKSYLASELQESGAKGLILGISEGSCHNI